MKIIIFNYFVLFFFQITAICRNDNPNAFDPFAVEVSISRMSYYNTFIVQCTDVHLIKNHFCNSKQSSFKNLI